MVSVYQRRSDNSWVKMASIGRGARDKGANYERRVAKILSAKFGVPVKRTGSQERWGFYSGDVNAPKNIKTILNDFFWECKNREAWAILNWFSKAKDDVRGDSMPVVVASKNNEDDYVFLTLQDFLKILYELEGYRKEED